MPFRFPNLVFPENALRRILLAEKPGRGVQDPALNSRAVEPPSGLRKTAIGAARLVCRANFALLGPLGKVPGSCESKVFPFRPQDQKGKAPALSTLYLWLSHGWTLARE